MRAWLWVVVTPIVTFFAIHSRRSAESARATAGEPGGSLLNQWQLFTPWPQRFLTPHLPRRLVLLLPLPQKPPLRLSRSPLRGLPPNQETHAPTPSVCTHLRLEP